LFNFIKIKPMDRKSFLTASTSKAKPAHVAQATQTARTSRINSGITPYAGPWGDNEVIHLLKRTMFGASIADINYFKTKTVTQAIDELVSIPPPASPPVNNYEGKNYQGSPFVDPNGVAKGATWVNAPFSSTANGFRENSMKSWWVSLMHYQGRNIMEKMVLFWHNHFATEINTYNDVRYNYKYLATLRQYALGDFKAFVKAITLDPMMLRYLNGFVNTKNAPDENYARELQELFCCGKGPNSQYTEDDVKAAARVLTGINIDNALVTYKFIATSHDATNKTFSGFYNNTVITGQTGAAGINEVDALVNMVLAGKPAGQSLPEAAYYICRKLYGWFVYYEIDAATETNVIAPMANAFYSANWDITAPLKLLLKSEHFFDSLNMGCQIKSPVDFTISAMREFNIPINNPDVTPNYDAWFQAYGVMSAFQQPLGDPPNVAGWPAYYQEPLFYEVWLNTDTLPKRAQVIDTLVMGNYGLIPAIDVIAYADLMSAPSDPGKLVSDVLKYLSRIDLSQVNKDYIKTTYLLSGQTNDIYWTQAWNLFNADRTNTVNKNVVKTRLQGMIKYIVDLAEYQLA
jgi:uncharacterized protein (DUF1800 family)